MPFETIDADIAHCVQYLGNFQNRDLQIQNFLTRYLIIQISGEYEKEIKKTVSKRISSSNDSELISFIDETIDRIRNFKMGDLKGILNKFDTRRGELFESWVTPEHATLYSNIIENRNFSAHGQPTQMTLDELIESHKKAKTVIKQFQHALYHRLSNQR